MKYYFKNMTRWNTEFIQFVLDQNLSWSQEDLNDNFDSVYPHLCRSHRPIWIAYNQKNLNYGISMVSVESIFGHTAFLLRLPRPSALVPEDALSALVVGPDHLTTEDRNQLALGISHLGQLIHCGNVCSRRFDGKWRCYFKADTETLCKENFGDVPFFFHDQPKNQNVITEFRKQEHERKVGRIQNLINRAERERDYFESRVQEYSRKLKNLTQKES